MLQNKLQVSWLVLDFGEILPTINGLARIQKTNSGVETGLIRIRKINSANQIGLTRLQKTDVFEQSALIRLNGTNNINQMGVVRIGRNNSSSLTSLIRIKRTDLNFNIYGLVWLFPYKIENRFYPARDISVGDWSLAPLFSKIAGNSSDIADWIYSVDPPAVSECEIGLTGFVGPTNYKNHIIQYVVQKEGTTLLQISFELYQGETFIASTSKNLTSNDLTTGSLTLTASQIAGITNYNDLRIKIIGQEK